MLLRLKNIGKIYNSNDILTIGIRNINLSFDYNEFVTIEGESGSGKSTLLNVIGANDTYEEGEMYFNELETSHFTPDDWNKYREDNIATIFQDFNIIENLTVLENVCLALLRYSDIKERKKIARELIGKVGLSKQINQKTSSLSGGEKQRTVIARALAKDSPIILADEPTGNLDVKASKEIAKLLKDVSKDKLVIVVTHNPEFFVEYATRRVRVYDGHIEEDLVISKPSEIHTIGQPKTPMSKSETVKNMFRLGFLNYRSRPKFSITLTCTLIVFAIMFFVIMSLFSNSLIQDYKTTLDDVAVTGKVIVSKENDDISLEDLDNLAYVTNASYYMEDRELSSFEVNISKTKNMLQSYDVICLYDPFTYNLKAGEGYMVIPIAYQNDANSIIDSFINANVGLYEINYTTDINIDNVMLYLSHDDLINNGIKIKAINSTVKMSEDLTATVYTFRVNEELEEGMVNIVNTTYYNYDEYELIFSIKANKIYSINTTGTKDDIVSGMIVEMNQDDYDAIFNETITSSSQIALYFESDDLAKNSLSLLGDEYIGMLSTSKVYVDKVSDVFTSNIICYLSLILIYVLCGILISIIFTRSMKIYQADFTIYRTLGIKKSISSGSLYIQMALIMIPTLIVLPLVSYIMAIIPASSFKFISIGNYFFIEILVLILIEIVGLVFNKMIYKTSIRKNLKRGSK